MTLLRRERLHPRLQQAPAVAIAAAGVLALASKLRRVLGRDARLRRKIHSAPGELPVLGHLKLLKVRSCCALTPNVSCASAVRIVIVSQLRLWT